MSSETPQPEYLDGEPSEPSRSGRRWGLVAGATVGVLAVAGAGAWGVSTLLGGGPGAAVAAPADTLAFLAVDLDPGAGQKVEAYKTLKKFPALADRLGGEENLRRSLVEAFLTDAPCDDLTWNDDFEPWLGQRLGAGVRPGGDEPVPFVVVQVTDETKATDAVEEIAACGEEDPELPGMAFVEDYMVLAEDDETAEGVAKASAESSLADDDGYTTWVDEAGGGGIVTGYLAAEGPKLLLEEFGDFGEDATAGTVAGRVAPATGELDDPSDLATMTPEELEEQLGELEMEDDTDLDLDPGPDFMEPDVDQLREAFEEFEGAAVVARFDDGALEVEAAMSAVGELDPSEASDSGLSELPATTAVALGLGVGDSVVEDMLASMAESMGQDAVDELVDQVEAETGLTPEKLQELLGDGVSVALDSSVDLESIFSSSSGIDVPAGIRIDGDPDTILPVLEELVTAAGADGVLQVESSDSAVAVGFDADYVAELVGDGDLGGQDGFKSALPDLGDSAGGFFVDFDAGDWLEPALESDGDEELKANFEPLDSLGATGELDGDVVRGVLRLSTD
ncbi:hypothetical protein [Nocardioides caldifontis]|uniref:hypothetical protein n=1 Tax=Nocardioides caldifontis TaxID=2588938 RepID=UPI0011DFC020|nr:hypothetical protein [Nocardioides caldifontis]